MSRRFVVVGATGLIGGAVSRALMARGDEVIVFTRHPEAAQATLPGAAEYVAWQAAESGPWARKLDGVDGLLNFAGASIGGRRWNATYKEEIRATRIIGTRGLVSAMAVAANKPQVFVNAAAVGYYGARGDEQLDESAPPGKDFLARLVKEWETEAFKAEEAGIRTVTIRSGFILDRQAESLQRLALPFKCFVGGPILPGTQWFPWIHLADEVGIILLALDNAAARGPINAVAPESTTNRTFSAALGRALRRPSWAPVPRFALRLVVGEFADTLVTGQRVQPKRAEALGYQFQYPTSAAALGAIYDGREE